MRWTKGKYAFFVVSHVDRPHPHVHIYYNSTSLESKTETAVDRAHTLAGELRAVEEQLTTTSELMGAVVNYAKTRPVFEGYKAAKYSIKYLAQHEQELDSYRAARATMNEILNGGKLPKMDALKKSRAELTAKRKELREQYRAAQRVMRELVTIKGNVDHLLGVTGGREDTGTINCTLISISTLSSLVLEWILLLSPHNKNPLPCGSGFQTCASWWR